MPSPTRVCSPIPRSLIKRSMIISQPPLPLNVKSRGTDGFGACTLPRVTHSGCLLSSSSKPPSPKSGVGETAYHPPTDVTTMSSIPYPCLRHPSNQIKNSCQNFILSSKRVKISFLLYFSAYSAPGIKIDRVHSFRLPPD